MPTSNKAVNGNIISPYSKVQTASSLFLQGLTLYYPFWQEQSLA